MPRLAYDVRILLALVLVVVVLGPAAAPQAGAPSFDRPCSFATAAEVSSALGATATATDEKYRCKYTVGRGWLETKLLDYGLKISRDIFDYNKAHGKPLAGVGDQAYLLGATLAVKVGDVIVIVDGSNVPHPPDNARLKAIALTIVHRIA